MLVLCHLSPCPTRIMLVAALLTVLAACAPTPAPTGESQPRGGVLPMEGTPQRTLVAIVRLEPTSLAPPIFREPGTTYVATPRLFNAGRMASR